MVGCAPTSERAPAPAALRLNSLKLSPMCMPYNCKAISRVSLSHATTSIRRPSTPTYSPTLKSFGRM
eukprot:scaffold153952_cov32-Tisochrysis_lutea.AAC.2